MIRCPECGQRALDVASVCPKCGHVLIQNPLETHDWGTLRECGRCGKHIERDAVICPYCGHHVRAARMAWRVAFGSGALILVAAVAVAAWRSGVIASIQETFRSPRPTTTEPQPAAPGPAAAAAPLDSAAVRDTVADTVRAAPIMAAGPESAPPDTAPRTPAVALRPADPIPPTTPTTMRRPRDLVPRWTVEWANVRAARSLESTVVQVLPPGRAVQVREMQRGWWALYAGGTVVGYIANSVLTATPPG